MQTSYIVIFIYCLLGNEKLLNTITDNYKMMKCDIKLNTEKSDIVCRWLMRLSGLVVQSPAPPVQMSASMSKTLNSKFLPIGAPAPYMAAPLPSVCVCEYVGWNCNLRGSLKDQCLVFSGIYLVLGFQTCSDNRKHLSQFSRPVHVEWINMWLEYLLGV